MPMAEDLALFFDVDEFASQATLDSVDVVGVFDNGYRDALGVIGVQDPTFTLPSSDCALVAQGSELTVSGDDYVVINAEPDGTGLTILRLQAA